MVPQDTLKEVNAETGGLGNPGLRPRVALDVDEVLCRTAEAFCTWQTGQPGMDLTVPRPARRKFLWFGPQELQGPKDQFL